MRAVLEDHLYFCALVEKWVVGRGRCMLEQTQVPGSKINDQLPLQLIKCLNKTIEEVVCSTAADNLPLN